MTGGRRLIVAVLACAGLVAAAPAGAVTFQEFPLAPGSLPRYIKAGPDGQMWFTNGAPSGGIERISTLGVVSPPFAGGKPVDLAFAGDGTLYWAGDEKLGKRLTNGKIDETSVESPAYAVAVGPGGVSSSASATFVCHGDIGHDAACHGPIGVTGRITGLAFDRDLELWAAFSENNTVREVLTPERVIELPPGSTPSRIALGPDGNLWVTMFGADAVDRITPEGARTRFHLSPGAGPNDIAVGPDGALWVTEYTGDRIARITSTGQVTGEYPVPTPGATPAGIAVGPDGAIWFTELAAGKIGRLAPDAPAPGGAGGDSSPGAGGAGDTTPPSFLVKPAFHPRRFKDAGRATRSTPKGSSLQFTLSEAAGVKLVISSSRPGHSVHGRCVAPSRSNSGKPRCRRHLAVGSLSVKETSGAHRVPFTGKVQGHTLKPGEYRASVVATDAAGNSSAPVVLTFIVAP